MPEGGGPDKFPQHDAPAPQVNLRDAEMEEPMAFAVPPHKIRPAQEKQSNKLRDRDAVILSGYVNPKTLPYESAAATRGHDGKPASLKGEKSGISWSDAKDRRIMATAYPEYDPHFPGDISPEQLRAVNTEDTFLSFLPYTESPSVMRVIEDIEHILAERRGLDRPFELQSTDVFFRVEAMAIATEITEYGYRPISTRDAFQGAKGLTAPTDLLSDDKSARKFEELIVSRPEYVEDDMMVDAEREFGLLVNELKELQESGAAEDVVFKKLLEQVNAFPYRQTANSLLKAFAGRSREHARTKRGFLGELARANELPGLNCEGRAKMFAGLLEAIGYSPTEDIFINWPELHVQTLLKKKDGTWLAFEGNSRRPFIQTFTGETSGICTLKEWKETLYGLPNAAVIASVKPKITINQEPKEEKVEPAWKETKLEKALGDALDVAKDIASFSASGIVKLFAGTPNEDERVANAYPAFEENADTVKKKTSGLKETTPTDYTPHGHADVLRKILSPRIAAAKRMFGGKVGVVIAALAAGCWFSYGAAHPTESDETKPPTADEVKKERNDWEELAEATLHEVAVDTSLAPHVFGEFDLVFKTQEGTVEQKQEGGETVHTLKLADSVRTMSPDVFVTMVKKDITQWAAGRGTTDSTWVIDGRNLDVHAAQRAITDMTATDAFIVSDAKIGEMTVVADQSFSVTWQFVGGEEDDQITLSFSAADDGPVTARGTEWHYTMHPHDVAALATIGKMEDRMLKTTYDATGWKAPLTTTTKR